MAATMAANLLGDRDTWSSVLFAVANAGDTVIIAGLIHGFCSSPFELNELRRVLALLPQLLQARASPELSVRQVL